MPLTDLRDILAIGVLAAAAAVLAVWLVVRLRRPPFTPGQWLLFGLNYIIVRVLWRTKIKGSFLLPLGQGAVIVSNHRCPVDPSFMEVAIPRVIHWMVAKEYCEHPAFRRLLATCEVIPVPPRRRRHGRRARGRRATPKRQAGGYVSRRANQHNRRASASVSSRRGDDGARKPGRRSFRCLSRAPRTTARRWAAC